ncbi:MAG TPA: alanine racemase [Phycisphaerae bacterium]|nr:alanine racemase [Phycisphaerae bacterium]
MPAPMLENAAIESRRSTCPRLWAEIGLDAILHNYEIIRRHVGPRVQLMAMVKSNAYGHGAKRVARLLEDAGAECFGVANLDEALELRRAGISRPVLITGPITAHEVADAVANDVQITLSPPDMLDMIEEQAIRQHKTVRLHLNIDTGMTRSGVPAEDAPDVAARVAVSHALELAGVATHFPLAEDEYVSREQLEQFNRTCSTLAGLDLLPMVRHAANTMGLFNVPGSHYEMVRPGIGLYGMYPHAALAARVQLEPAMTVRTQIVYVREVPAGTPIGYGHTYRTTGPTRIATLPIGYADGFHRSLSNRGRVIVNGRYAPVVGAVSMDMLTVDVGHVPGVHVGTPVTIIGAEGEARITAEEHAEQRGTIPYEVTCLIGKRVKRQYRAAEREVSLTHEPAA